MRRDLASRSFWTAFIMKLVEVLPLTLWYSESIRVGCCWIWFDVWKHYCISSRLLYFSSAWQIRRVVCVLNLLSNLFSALRKIKPKHNGQYTAFSFFFLLIINHIYFLRNICGWISGCSAKECKLNPPAGLNNGQLLLSPSVRIESNDLFNDNFFFKAVSTFP